MLIDMSQMNEGLHANALPCMGPTVNAARQKHVDATENTLSMPYSWCRCQDIMINELQSLQEVTYHTGA